MIRNDSDVVAVLTGNVLKDPDYIRGYHTGVLRDPRGTLMTPAFANPPHVLPNDRTRITAFLES
jgi:threonine synthase